MLASPVISPNAADTWHPSRAYEIPSAIGAAAWAPSIARAIRGSIVTSPSRSCTAFVVTELVEGETLRTRLEGGPLPSRRAVAYALQIARGIAAAHARGIVRRDLTPENVMITHDDPIEHDDVPRVY